MTAPLHDIRIVDLSNFVFGPVATQLLGDMGAEVIKVEPPGGDPTRGIGKSRNDGMGSFFLNLNRNKKSVVLDLKDSRDAEAFRRLLETADVLVHNMRSDAERKLGIDYSSLAPSYPRLIHAVALGFAKGGPYSERPAYDDVIQGLSGLAGLQSQLAGAPAYIPMLMADKLSGVALSNAICAALVSRCRTGRGQSVQVPMFETVTSFVLLEHLADAALAPSPDTPAVPLGYARALSPTHRPLSTADGLVCLVANTDAQWQRLFDLIGRPDYATDPRFANIGSRMRHLEALYAVVEGALRTRTTAEWLGAFENADIPASPVSSLQEVRSDPHLVHTGFFQTVPHATEGALLTTKSPYVFSASEPATCAGPPRLGEHTEEILQSLGLPPRGRNDEEPVPGERSPAPTSSPAAPDTRRSPR
ncbi:MAG: CoA transferase [Burkholderiales bacterium]|nr:CoA transferase [Burkholderiales bacterium]